MPWHRRCDLLFLPCLTFFFSWNWDWASGVLLLVFLVSDVATLSLVNLDNRRLDRAAYLGEVRMKVAFWIINHQARKLVGCKIVHTTAPSVVNQLDIKRKLVLWPFIHETSRCDIFTLMRDGSYRPNLSLVSHFRLMISIGLEYVLTELSLFIISSMHQIYMVQKFRLCEWLGRSVLWWTFCSLYGIVSIYLYWIKWTHHLLF